MIFNNPTDETTLSLKKECEGQIASLETALAPLQQKLASLQAQLPHDAKKPKFDPEKHPVLKKAVDKNEAAKAVVFNTGDMCEAQWNDRQWYKAKIQTILGSVSAPKYHVRFLDYDDTMTVDREAIRPLQNKRKWEDANTPAAASATPVAPVTSTPLVISGPASANPNAQAAKKEPSGNPAVPNRKKIPNQKRVNAAVNNWKQWSSKGAGKQASQKQSMFRLGSNPNSRGTYFCPLSIMASMR